MSSWFKVLDPKGFLADLEKEGMSIEPQKWKDVGAFGVIKARATLSGGKVKLSFKLYETDKGAAVFRLTSDDGSELLIDDGLVIDHDGLHGETDKDGTVELTAGTHALRVNYFEAGGGQELTLSWRPPGASSFSVVPNSALSTDAGVVRVTAPGSKQCEGDVDTPGDGLPLESVNPAYDLVNLRPAGFEPKVSGLEWMGDDLLVLTWGDDDGDPSSVTAAGEVWRLSGVKDADDPADVTPTTCPDLSIRGAIETETLTRVPFLRWRTSLS